MNIDLLKKLGFSDKHAKIYLTLLKTGPTSVRKLAELTEINRGTTYDILKWLQDKDVVNYYQQDKKQFFVAEDPKKLRQVLKNEQQELEQMETKLDKLIPELEALYEREGERPVAQYFDRQGLKNILTDVLQTCEQHEKKQYRVYSSSEIADFLYEDFADFSDVRIAKGIAVKSIRTGEGGIIRGLDERKWLNKKQAKEEVPTYIIIYPGKTAYISLDNKKEPVGVIINNQGIYDVQKQIFNTLWTKL